MTAAKFKPLILSFGVTVGVLLAADQFVWVSGLPLGPLTRFYLALLSSSGNYFILLSKASSLTRKRVCSLQCNHSLVPITIHYRLIWDCVPFLSPLTTRRDYGGGILTRLDTGYTFVSFSLFDIFYFQHAIGPNITTISISRWTRASFSSVANPRYDALSMTFKQSLRCTIFTKLLGSRIFNVSNISDKGQCPTKDFELSRYYY
jgi:hypothetical protein